jgi:hypothetical protein
LFAPSNGVNEKLQPILTPIQKDNAGGDIHKFALDDYFKRGDKVPDNGGATTKSFDCVSAQCYVNQLLTTSLSCRIESAATTQRNKRQ